MPTSASAQLNRLLQRADLLFTFALFAPCSCSSCRCRRFLLDLLLALNIGMSLLVLLVVVYVKDPRNSPASPRSCSR